jgi:hypothetical protein
MLKALNSIKAETACKVCGGRAALFGVVDFNKSCLENQDVFLPLLGVPVYYHRCESCGLLFSVAFDDWAAADFRTHIYNEGYGRADPDYREVRPRQVADMIFNFIRNGRDLKLLDYGGGEGVTAHLLRERGIDAVSWDLMTEDSVPQRAHFDVVTCFEVFEHTATPRMTAEDALTFLGGEGVLLFSTLTVEELTPRDITSWYIAPRNGHITIYSKKALKTLFAQLGCTVHHFNDNVHMAYKKLPPWLA